MDTLGQAVAFPVNEMLLAEDGPAGDSVVVGEMGATGGPQGSSLLSAVFSTPNLSDGTTLLSLPFTLLHEGLTTTTGAMGTTGTSRNSASNTTNIIIKQSSVAGSLTSSSSHGSTIFLDATQMALLSSGGGQVVLTGGDAFLEDGQQHSETQQIFLQVTSDSLPEARKKGDGTSILEVPTNAVPMQVTLRNSEQGVAERRPVLPGRKRGPGRPRRDDSKMVPPSVKGVWFCQVCGKEFNKWPLLRKHLKSHSDDKPHRCSECPASFNVPWNLKLHEATHARSSPSPLNCPACSRTFSRIASLKAHVMLHEEDESLFCAHCGEEFSTQGQLDKHIKVHEFEESNVDPLSMQPIMEAAVWISDAAYFKDAGFVGSRVDQSPQQETHNPLGGGQQCRLCNALFRKASQLREHMKEHSKVKASLSRRSHKRNIDRSSFLHKCDNCMKGFQKPSQLVRHMRIHTGERPYQCSTCGRAFNQKGSLQIHMTKHTGVKPFSCEFCSAGFRQRGNLRAHILRVHSIPVSGEQAFRCCECSCVFRKLGSLNAHVSRVHGNGGTSSGGTVNRKRKRADGSSGVGDSMEEDVSDVLRDLEELEEATRRLGGGGGDPTRGEGEEEGVGKKGSRVGAGGEVDGVVVASSADILQQALEKSGLSDTKKDDGSVIGSSASGSRIHSEKEKSADGAEMPGATTEKETVQSAADGHTASQSCMLTLADEGHDGTVRRYSIKVRRSGGVRWHQCTYCPKEFKKPSDLVRHIRIHTHEKPYKCYMCFRAFAVKSTLTVHLRIHSGLKSYQCVTCNKKFASQSSLKVHQRLHSGLKPFSCPYCNLRFRTTGHRKTHISTHFRMRSRLGKKQKVLLEDVDDEEEEEGAMAVKRVLLQDPIVVQQSTDPAEVDPHSLQEHHGAAEDEQHGNPKVQHKDGGALSTVPQEVIVAMGLPEGTVAQQVVENRPHQCKQCQAAFKKLSHLKQHRQSHTGEKPYICTSCNKSFVSRGVLKAHLKTHIPVMSPFRRAFECSECSKKFMVAGSLKRHMINAHENLRKSILKQTFLCPYCNALPFNSNKACRKHIATHTSELLEAQERQEEQERQHQQQEAAEHHQQPDDGSLGDKGIHQQQEHQQDSGACLVVEDGGAQLQSIPDGTQLAVIADVGHEVHSVALTAEDRQEVVGANDGSENVVVTFSLDFPPVEALGGPVEVISRAVATIEGGVEEQASSQAVATISLTDTDALSQENLRQIEQTLGGGMFADPDTIDPNATSGGSSQTSAHIKDPSLDFETHTISFDPSVFSNISLPSGDALSLHTSLQQMEVIDGTASASETTAVNGDPGVKDEQDSRPRKRKIHKCTYCDRVFKKCSHMKQHLRTHTGEKPYQCLVCLRMFVTMGTLKAHFRTHTGEKSFGCDSCGAHFTTNGSLRRHMSIHSEENHYQCERCPQSFRTVGQWRRHWRSHENELIGPMLTEDGQEGTEEVQEGAEGVANVAGKEAQQSTVAVPPYKRSGGGRRRNSCSVPPASPGIIRLTEEETSRLAMQSPSQPHLTLSERVLIASAAERGRVSEINDKEKRLQTAPKLPHVCSHCPKSFRKPSDLARHIRTHTGERPFECDKCGKRFTVKSTLDSHQITHPPDGEGIVGHPKYPCHVCGCLFATKGSLKVHMRLHTGARPFKCPHCEQRFRTSGHRKAHLVTHLRVQTADGKGSGGRGGAGGRGRLRRAKAVALEAMRSIEAALNPEAHAQSRSPINAPMGDGEDIVQHPGAEVVEDWGTLQANLEGGPGGSGEGGGFQLQLEGGGGLSLQLDEGLLRQIQQHALREAAEEAEAAADIEGGALDSSEVIVEETADGGGVEVVVGEGGDVEEEETVGVVSTTTTSANSTEEDGVVGEPLSFETSDVSSLFGHPLEVILQQHQQGEEGKADRVAAGWTTEGGDGGHHPLGVLDEDGNVSLVIDGDFVIEEDGILRRVVGGECVVLSALAGVEDGDGIEGGEKH